jgi:hypothetical protein
MYQTIIQAGPVGLIGLFWVLILLIIIGSIIIWIAGALIFFLPAFIIAGIVYWITGDDTLAGLAFLLVALSSLTRKK